MKTALVVEDFDPTRNAYLRALCSRGYRTTAPSDRRELKAILESGQKYSLAIIDHRLWAGQRGTGIAIELKESERVDDVVIVTAFRDDLNEDELRDLSIDIQDKPITLPQILTALASASPVASAISPNSREEGQIYVARRGGLAAELLILIRVFAWSLALAVGVGSVWFISKFELTILRVLVIALLFAVVIFGVIGAKQHKPLASVFDKWFDVFRARGAVRSSSQNDGDDG